jgi:hypothetical protein
MRRPLEPVCHAEASSPHIYLFQCGCCRYCEACGASFNGGRWWPASAREFR